MDTPPADLPDLDRANLFAAVERGLLDANTATRLLLERRLARLRGLAMPAPEPAAAQAGPDREP